MELRAYCNDGNWFYLHPGGNNFVAAKGALEALRVQDSQFLDFPVRMGYDVYVYRIEQTDRWSVLLSKDGVAYSDSDPSLQTLALKLSAAAYCASLSPVAPDSKAAQELRSTLEMVKGVR